MMYYNDRLTNYMNYSFFNYKRVDTKYDASKIIITYSRLEYPEGNFSNNCGSWSLNLDVLKNEKQCLILSHNLKSMHILFTVVFALQIDASESYMFY